MADENVNIQDEADYYYDMTPTAEEIDNVLVDLVAALKDVGEFDVVKRVKAINGERAKFVLGEGGSGKTTIPGALDQLVAADGQGNAKANSGCLFSKIGAVADFSNASILESKLPAMKIELAGTSSTEDYWENSHSGILAMAWNPLVQFLGSPTLGSPVFSMADRAVIDIRGVSGTSSANFERNSRNGEYPEWRSKEAYWTFSGMPSPFKNNYKMSNDGLIYPYLQMGESSTVIMREAALLQMRDGSSIMTAGNGQITVRGAGTPTESDGHKVPYSAGYGRTLFQMEPGTVFCMQDGKNPLSPPGFGPLFLMTESGGNNSQIYLTNQRVTTVDDLYGSDRNNPLHNYLYEGTKTPSPMTSNLNDIESWGFARSKLSLNDYSIPSKSSSIIKPSLMIQGKSNIVIGDTGTTGIRIGPAGGAEFYMDLVPDGGSSSLIRFGPGGGSKFVLDLSTNSGSNQFIKIGGGSGTTKQIFAFEPMCDTSIKFSPNVYDHEGKGVFGLSMTPAKTDIVAQWDAFEGIFEGNQVFAQVEGDSHFEFLDDSTIIMRGPSAIGWDASTRTNSSADKAIKITTSTNCNGFTYEEFWATLTEDQKEEVLEFLTPTFSSTGRVVLDGTVTATEHYADRYHIVVEGATVPKASGTSYNFSFIKSGTYSQNASTVMGWQEFEDAVKEEFGENAIASNVTVQSIRQYSWGYLHCIQAQITNASAFCNSETEYAIGTSYEDLTDAEKTQLIDGRSTWDFSTTTVISNDVRSDMTYDNVCQNYTYRTGTHLCQDWIDPVYAKTGPVTQMYGLSNFCMRGNLRVKDNNGHEIQSQQITTFTITPTETYDFSKTNSELINDLINGADYTELNRQVEAYLSVNTHYHFDHIYSIYEGEENTIQVSVVFEYKKIEHMENLAPLVEIIGNSEIRIANGISITTDNIDGESAIKIAAPEGEVSFTLAELKALKNLIANT